MFHHVYELLKQSFNRFLEERAGGRGAAIAFYVVTSIAPLILLVIAIAGLAFGRDAASGAIFTQFRDLIGPTSADVLQKAILSASNKPASLVASVIGVVTLLITGSGVFLELEDALNAIWGEQPKGGLWSMATARVYSLGLVAALGFLLMVSLVVNAGLNAMGGTIDTYLPFGAGLLIILSFLVSTALIAVLFAAIYKLLPAKPIAWHDVIIGAVVTALLFQIGKFLIGMYLGSDSAVSSLGAAGALLGLLFWVYYSAQIFLFGACFTYAYSESNRKAFAPGVAAGMPQLQK
jgi:membrane protein